MATQILNGLLIHPTRELTPEAMEVLVKFSVDSAYILDAYVDVQPWGRSV